MKNLLVVDDNKCIRDLLSQIAAVFLKGCSVHTAENGVRAARIFDSVPVSAIVTDLSMPVMDGYQFMEYVRRRSSAVSIIAMTADPGGVDGGRLKSLDVKRLLEKPFDIRVAARELASALDDSFSVPASSRQWDTTWIGLQTL